MRFHLVFLVLFSSAHYRRQLFLIATWTLAIAMIVSIAVELFWNLIWCQLTKPNNRVVDHFILGDSTVESSCLNWEKYKVWSCLNWELRQ